MPSITELYNQWFRHSVEAPGSDSASRMAGLVSDELLKSVQSFRIPQGDKRLEVEKQRAGIRIRENQDSFTEQLNEHMGDYRESRITKGQAAYRIKRAIREHYRTAFELGKRSSGNLYLIEPAEELWLRKLRYDEFRYLNKFLTDVENDAGKMSYDRRIDMYGKAIREVVWMGWLLGNRSRRRYIVWRWTEGKEHCPDCAEFNGKKWTVEQFIKHVKKTGKLPQSGALKCLGYNCGCHLEEQFVGR